MSWLNVQVVLIAIAATFSPLSLVSSILALVLSKRPLRTGGLFYLGAFTVALVNGILAAVLLGSRAASRAADGPKTWVTVVDVVGAALLVVFAIRLFRRPVDPARAASRVGQMGRVAESPPIAILGAGAVLANPIVLKAISQTNPSTARYIGDWLVFIFIALLPLAIGMLMLIVAPDRTTTILGSMRDWLTRHLEKVMGALALLVAASLLRDAISGLLW